MIKTIKYLYNKNPRGVKIGGTALTLHNMAIGLVMPYTMLIQLRFVSFRTVLILNNFLFILGTLILYLQMRGYLRVSDVRKRMAIAKLWLDGSKLAVIYLLLFGASGLLGKIMLAYTFLGGTLAYPTINTDVQYLMFKLFNLKDRAKMTSFMGNSWNISIISMSAVSSLFYHHLAYVYLTSFIIDIIAITLWLKFIDCKCDYVPFGRIRSNVHGSQYLLLSAWIILLIVLMTLTAVKPVILEYFGEQYVGYFFTLGALISVFMFTYVFPLLVKIHKIEYRTLVTLLVALVIMIPTVFSPAYAVFGVLLGMGMINISIFSLRHKAFKDNDSKHTWGVTALNEFNKVFSNIVLLILAIVTTDITAKTVLIFDIVLMSVSITMLLYKVLLNRSIVVKYG